MKITVSNERYRNIEVNRVVRVGVMVLEGNIKALPIVDYRYIFVWCNKYVSVRTTMR